MRTCGALVLLVPERVYYEGFSTSKSIPHESLISFGEGRCERMSARLRAAGIFGRLNAVPRLFY